jgi:predicted aspartyl protease
MSKSQGSCFTIEYSGISPSLKSEVTVCSSALSKDTPRTLKADALWDTGAMSTVITPAAAKNLGLKVISKTTISTPSGTMVCNQYFVDIILTNNIKVTDILITEATPSNCDVLIGMDIILLGDFAVTHFEGKTVFTFRVPSMQRIDFTRYSYL